jgi:hypothetical protein
MAICNSFVSFFLCALDTCYEFVITLFDLVDLSKDESSSYTKIIRPQDNDHKTRPIPDIHREYDLTAAAVDSYGVAFDEKIVQKVSATA